MIKYEIDSQHKQLLLLVCGKKKKKPMWSFNFKKTKTKHAVQVKGTDLFYKTFPSLEKQIHLHLKS